MTDAPRTVIGPDDVAAVVRIIVIGRAAVEGVSMKTVPVIAAVTIPAEMRAAAMQASNAEAAATEAAGPKCTAVKAATEATTMKSTTVESTDMAAASTAAPADIDQQSTGGLRSGRRCARIEQRHRVRAPVGRNRQHQHHDSRKREARNERAACNGYVFHGRSP